MPVQRILHQRCWQCWRHLEGLTVHPIWKAPSYLKFVVIFILPSHLHLRWEHALWSYNSRDFDRHDNPDKYFLSTNIGSFTILKGTPLLFNLKYRTKQKQCYAEAGIHKIKKISKSGTWSDQICRTIGAHLGIFFKDFIN